MVRRSGDRPAILRSPTWPALAILAALVGAACSAPEPSEPSEDEYVAAMEAVCTATAAELDALAQPADGADRVGFALAAASAIGDEAERAREVEPPGATEADHRAFIANTDEQAAGWREIAEVPDDDADALNVASGQIARLTLGRNELAEEMGLDACRRGGT